MGHPHPSRRHRPTIDPRLDPYFCDWAEVVGGRIRRLRRARGISLRDLADKLVLPGGTRHSIGYLSRLERGWASAPFFTYVAIIELLGADPGRVLGPDVADVDPAESTLLECLRDVGIPPHDPIVQLLSRPLDPDVELAAVDGDRLAAAPIQ